jgi:S1-C subfamily serine protease
MELMKSYLFGQKSTVLKLQLLNLQTNNKSKGFLIILIIACISLQVLTGCSSPVKINSSQNILATSTLEPTSVSKNLGLNFGKDNISNRNMPSVSDVVTKVRPTLVSISVVSTNLDIFLRAISKPSAGSGITIDPSGYIVTNFHVIDGAENLTVTLPDGRTFPANVIGVDQLSDLAVIKIEATDLPAASFGDSDKIKIGDWVIAMGNALNLKGGPTVTLGILSAKGRTIDTQSGTLYDLIQTDAAINDGNSGGPLLDLSGQVIGINSAILRQAQGIGFAISSNTATPIIKSMIEIGQVIRPLIGLNGRDVTPGIANQLGLETTNGIVVSRIFPNGPTDNAGLVLGDVITSIDGKPTDDIGQFLTILWTYLPGNKITIEYIREGLTKTTVVELVER